MKNNQDIQSSPKVSIITVCFNEGEDIKNTCESVISQSYGNYEWIVVDGGSTDNTLEILDGYKSHFSILISEKDNGVYDAMNKGIRIARGDYLIFLNGGDYFYEKNVLKKVFSENLYNGDVMYGNCCVLLANGSKTILDFENKIDKYYLLNTCINHQSTFIKRNLFEKYGLYDESYKILADYDKWLCFINNKAIFQKIPFVISNFKAYDGLSSHKKSSTLTQQDKQNIIKKYFSISNILFYKLRNYEKNDFRFSLWLKVTNCFLRQPARRLWYFMRGKKIN